MPAKDGLAVIDTPRNSSPATPLEQPSTTKPNPTSLRTKGHFVHSLCGKAFTTRSGVKKHHWGARLYDKNTTSGCWAKNGKPDVDWDDHPSCKDPPQDDKDGDIDSEQQASPTPVAQMVVPARHATTTTQVPTSRESSARARQCTAISPSTPHTAVRPGNPFSSPGPLSTTADDHNLQTLITAVNVASSIESPAPQTRNDSVVTHLDAQVKSWEHQAQAQHQNAFLVPDDQARTQSIELQHNGSGCGGGYGSGYLADTRPSASASASASVPPNQSQNQNFDLDPATFVHEYAGSDKAMANSMLTGNAPARGTPAIFAENHSHGGTALDLNRSQNRSFVLPSQNQINVQKRGRAPTTLDGSGSGAGLAARPAAGPQVDGFALNPDAPRKRQRSGHGNGDGNGNGSADAFGKGRQRDAKGESV